MSDDYRQWDEVQETERRQRDIAALPETMRDAARFSGSEVMWPKSVAHDAIDALVEGGHVVLGLDLRKYEPDGRFYEVAWSVYQPTGSGDLEASRRDAIGALSRPNISEMDGYEWVLITWE